MVWESFKMMLCPFCDKGKVKVRHVPARKVMEAASASLRTGKPEAGEAKADCGCSENLSESSPDAGNQEPCCNPAMMTEMMRKFAGRFAEQNSGDSSSEPGGERDSHRGCGS